MIIDDYMDYLIENYDLYDEDGTYRPKGIVPASPSVRPECINKRTLTYSGKNSMNSFLKPRNVSYERNGYHMRYAEKDRIQDVGNKLNKKRKAIEANRPKAVENTVNNVSKSGVGKKAALIAAGVAAGAGAAYGAKKLHDHIKAKRAEKARKVALEDGCTLDEAYDFILECEMDLINEGYELYEIYED